MLDDSQRVTSPSPASSSAMNAMSTASPTTVSSAERCTIASTTRPASTGVATASTAETTLSSRNHTSIRRCDRANPPMRRNVALENGLRSSCACIALYIECHAVTSMSMTSHRILVWAAYQDHQAVAGDAYPDDRRST